MTNPVYDGELWSGSVWYNGTTVPTETLGLNGDFFVNFSNNKIYEKQADTWVEIINMKGIKGSTGQATPGGGSIRQLLVKNSNTNYDASWRSLNQSDITSALGFIPLSAESDTLITVTSRGSSTTNVVTISNLTASTSTTTGALKISGGLGIQKTLRAGSFNGDFIGSATGNITGNVVGTVRGKLTGNVTGNVTGNANTVANAVLTTGNYVDPSWLNISAAKVGLATVASTGSYTDLSSTPSPYVLPVATTSTIGGVKLGSSISISPSGVISGYAGYVLPTASPSVLGGVKVDGSTITINGSGVISSTAYSLPAATNQARGGIRVDGFTLTVVNQVLTRTAYTPPLATTLVTGVFRIDDSTVTLNGSNQLTTTGGNNNLQIYTSGSFGGRYLNLIQPPSVPKSDGVLTRVFSNSFLVNNVYGLVFSPNNDIVVGFSSSAIQTWKVREQTGTWVANTTLSNANNLMGAFSYDRKVFAYHYSNGLAFTLSLPALLQEKQFNQPSTYSCVVSHPSRPWFYWSINGTIYHTIYTISTAGVLDVLGLNDFGLPANVFTIDPTGRFLVRQIPGASTLNVHSIDQTTGLLSGSISSQGGINTANNTFHWAKNGRYLYISNSNQGHSLYSFSSSGALGYIGDPFPNIIAVGGHRLAIDGTGNYLFRSNGQTLRIETYKICSDGTLLQDQDSQLCQNISGTHFLFCDPGGKHLYVANNTNGIEVFSIRSEIIGNLISGEIRNLGSTITTGLRARSISSRVGPARFREPNKTVWYGINGRSPIHTSSAVSATLDLLTVSPNGQYYAMGSSSQNSHWGTIDTLVGLTNREVLGMGPREIAWHPNGQTFYFIDGVGNNSFNAYLINGAGTATTSTSYTNVLPAPPQGIAVHPNGRYVYISTASIIYRYLVDQSSTANVLQSQRTVYTIPTGTSNNMKIDPMGKRLYLYTTAVGGTTNFYILTIGPDGELTNEVRTNDTSSVSFTLTTFYNQQIDPTGRYLVAHSNSQNSLYIFTIDPYDGRLNNPPQVIIRPSDYSIIGAKEIAFDPTGRYFALPGTNSVVIYELKDTYSSDQSLVYAHHTISLSFSPRSVQFDKLGRFLLVQSSTQVFAYAYMEKMYGGGAVNQIYSRAITYTLQDLDTADNAVNRFSLHFMRGNYFDYTGSSITANYRVDIYGNLSDGQIMRLSLVVSTNLYRPTSVYYNNSLITVFWNQTSTSPPSLVSLTVQLYQFDVLNVQNVIYIWGRYLR